MIKIAYLYPELLDLYGESGNIKALKYALEQKGITAEITNINYDTKLDLKSYDFVYLGSGEPSKLELVKTKLQKNKATIMEYINDNKIILVTGNALSLLDLLGYYEIEKQTAFKVADVIATTSLVPGNIYGFQNTSWLIKTLNSPLFKLDQGFGNNATEEEGFKFKNFYVTSLIGPILARNTNLTNYFVDLLISNSKK